MKKIYYHFLLWVIRHRSKDYYQRKVLESLREWRQENRDGLRSKNTE